MLLEIIIGASIVSLGITAISIAGISFAQKLYIDDLKFERLERIPLINGVFGELKNCPFCNERSNDFLANGLICKSFLDKNDEDGLRKFDWSKSPTGPSSAIISHTEHGIRLYQACLRCYAEWHTMPLLEDKPSTTKISKIIKNKK